MTGFEARHGIDGLAHLTHEHRASALCGTVTRQAAPADAAHCGQCLQLATDEILRDQP